MSNIKLIRTKGYHSRMNGAIERFNRTIQTVLKKITIIPTEWDEKLQYAVFAYNSFRHEVTGESPHYLMYGRDARVPMKSDPEERIGNYQTDLDDYKFRHAEQMNQAQEETRNRIRKEQESAKRWFDEKHRVVSRKNVIVEGCECPNGPCQVREGSAVVTSVEELAMKIFAREKAWPQEDQHLLIHAETFKQMLGETEKVEALRKFAKTCPAVAKFVMNEGEIGAKWRTAVNALRNETLERSKPRKTVLKEKVLLVGPKLGIRSRCTLEYRLAAVEDWVDKFDWSNTESPLGELVEKLALEVTDVTIVPSRMLCTFDEVQNVTNYWKKTWRTAANVHVVDPMSLIGEKKTPLILSEWKIGSWDRLMEFLKLAVQTHRIMARLLKKADVAEPSSKKHKLAN
uniref:Integrase catalytic domain-containing protein n=1 Tax=Caenorhabditis japonica TaxID=281687 RepID=A0A8R1HNE6_CAEJA